VCRFPQTEGKVVTLTNLERTFKSVRDHVDKSRNQWVAREALSARVESEENAEERAKRIALELMRDEEKEKEEQANKQHVVKEKEIEKEEKEEQEKKFDETPR
jgi:hypothetical protein